MFPFTRDNYPSGYRGRLWTFRQYPGFGTAEESNSRFWQAFAAEAGIAGIGAMHDRAAQRDEVLALVTQALATDTAANWEERLKPLGVPGTAVRTLPEALAEVPGLIVQAGGFRLVGTLIRIAGHDPGYEPPPPMAS